MFRVACLAAILVCVHSINDFETDSGNFRFIYHDDYNLLLTVHADACYFSTVTDDYNREHYYLIYHRNIFEEYIFDNVANGHLDKVHNSTLEGVRDEYGDLLADFTCADKHIYKLDFSFSAIRDAYHNSN